MNESIGTLEWWFAFGVLWIGILGGLLLGKMNNWIERRSQ